MSIAANDVSKLIEAADIFYLLWGSAQVFFMQAGFSMLEVGSVQKNCTINVLLKNTFDATITIIFWGIMGHAMAFGGSDSTGILPTFEVYSMEDHGFVFWLFQWSFASTAATIVSGAVAERIKFRAYVIYSVFSNVLTYPMVVHWVWSAEGIFSAGRNEALFRCGVLDFAGSGVVHYTGGFSALIAIWVLGKRFNVKYEKGEKTAPEPQSESMRVFGTFVLWYGWFGFNGASTLAIVGSSDVAARAILMTGLASGIGGITTAATGLYFKPGEIPNLGENLNGILAALVGITANCATVGIEGALIIGIVSSLLSTATIFLLNRLELDDAVGAVEVHMTGGIWALIAAGFFTKPEYYKEVYGNDTEACSGIFYGGTGQQLAANLVFLVMLTIWIFCTVGVLFIVLHHFELLRVGLWSEQMGVDATHHNTDNLDPLEHEMDRAIDEGIEAMYNRSVGNSFIDDASNSVSEKGALEGKGILSMVKPLFTTVPKLSTRSRSVKVGNDPHDEAIFTALG